MKLLVGTPRVTAHEQPLSYAVWVNATEVISVSADKSFIRWNVPDQNIVEATPTKLCSLPAETSPTCLRVQPTSASGTGGGRRIAGGHGDVVAAGGSDGKVYIVSRGGRMEKAVEAHQGAVLSLNWIADGSAFVTGGEDGHVKIWSRAGMYRNTLVQCGNPVYGVAWSPDSDSILYTDGENLTVKPRQAGSKHTQWKAHEAAVVCVDWNSTNNTIVSGGEDRTYRVWDAYGRPLFSSKARFHQFPILDVCWSSDGSVFAVGSYDTIRLCDATGWSAAMDKSNAGGIYNIDWNRDGTGFVCGCGDGRLVHGRVVEKTFIWRHLEATLVSEKSIVVRDTSNDIKELIEVNTSVVQTSIGWDHLIVVTATPSVAIYNSKNWSTPAMIDLKDATVTLIKQTERHFLLAGSAGIHVYTYDGRVIATIRCHGIQCDMLTEKMVTVSANTVAIRDRKNEQAVFLFEALSGKAVGDGQPYKHQTEINQILLDQCGPPAQRNLAILDRNRDVYLMPVRQLQGKVPPVKIVSMTSQMMWDDQANILATVEDGSVQFHCNPASAFVDQSLLKLSKIQPSNEVARYPTIVAFSGNRATLRRQDGAIIVANMDPYTAFLHQYAVNSRWADCLRLCRFVDKKFLWACLGGVGLLNKDISTATAAYAALSNAAKVMYLDKIASIPSMEGRNGEIALLCHQQQLAEQIFMQAGLVYRAIDMHIRLCNWEKALELATKHKTHVDTVLAYRAKYLESFSRKETNKKFIQYAQGMEVDWEKIKAKIALEHEKEGRRRQQ